MYELECGCSRKVGVTVGTGKEYDVSEEKARSDS